MRLRQIEVFRAVMLTGTVSEAARLLHVSQPVVTRVLQHAEASLGFRLFDRAGGRLRPTPEAEALVGDVERLYGEIDRVRRVSESLRHKGAGRLRVAATPSLADPLLVPALQRFCARHPETQVQVLTHHTDEIVQGLLRHQIDIGFAFAPAPHEAIAAVPVAEGRMLLAAPAGQPLPASGRRATLPMARLMERAFIGYDDQSSLGVMVRQASARNGLEPRSTVEVQTYSLARKLVESGLGVALLDQYTALGADPAAVTLHEIRPALPFAIQMLRASHRGIPSLADRLREDFTTVAQQRDSAVALRLATPAVVFEHALK